MALINMANNILSNDFVRLLVLILGGIYAGYTLQPIPEWLNNLFNKSNVFKFLILMMIGLVASYPINEQKIMNVIIISIFILVFFELKRKID